MICPSCLSSRLRLSHIQKRDFSLLLILRFPVRCRTCRHRMHAGPLFMLHLWQERRRKHQVAESKEAAGRAA